jgi:hypothetical protein
MTVRETSMTGKVSTSVAPRHARACNANMRLNAANAPCLRNRFTPSRTQFHPQTGFPLPKWSRSASEMSPIGQSATLKIHK